jgi:DNA-binding MarR family transcriptional regulator
MSSRDGERRIRNEIEGVLHSYGLTFEHINRGRHQAYQFVLNGKNVFFTYGGGGGSGGNRAHLNARSDLRRMLRDSGINKVCEEPSEIIETEAVIGATMEADAKVEITSELIEQEIAVPDEPHVQVPPEPDPDPPKLDPGPPKPPPLMVSSGYTYQSPRVLGIKLSKDLLVVAGNVLVIPLDRPNTVIEMTEEQFSILFNEVREYPPEPPKLTERTQPPRPLPRPLPLPTMEPEAEAIDYQPSQDVADILAYLKTRRGAVKTEVVAEALGKTRKSIDAHMRRLVSRGLVEAGPTGFWSLVNQATIFKPVLQPKPAAPPLFGRGRPAGKVPPQIGRILLAMAHAQQTTGKDNISPTMVSAYLDVRDNRQFTARMPSAVERGLVERGLPYPDRRGYHYKLTKEGQSLVREIGVWPFEVEGLQPPEWISGLF